MLLGRKHVVSCRGVVDRRDHATLNETLMASGITFLLCLIAVTIHPSAYLQIGPFEYTLALKAMHLHVHVIEIGTYL